MRIAPKRRDIVPVKRRIDQNLAADRGTAGLPTQELLTLDRLKRRRQRAQARRRVGNRNARSKTEAWIGLLKRLVIAVIPRAFQARAIGSGHVHVDSREQASCFNAPVDEWNPKPPRELIHVLTCYPRVKTRQNHICPEPAQRYAFHGITDGFNAKRGIDSPQLSRLRERLELAYISWRYILRLKIARLVNVFVDQGDAANLSHSAKMRHEVRPYVATCADDHHALIARLLRIIVSHFRAPLVSTENRH
jgi:hypothetical protein